MRKKRGWRAELFKPQKNKAVYKGIESNGLKWH